MAAQNITTLMEDYARSKLQKRQIAAVRRYRRLISSHVTPAAYLRLFCRHRPVSPPINNTIQLDAY